MPSTKDADDITQNAILIVTEYLSGRVILIPTTMRATGKDLARLFLLHIIKYFGLPTMFISDRDPRALSDFFQAFEKLMGIHHEFATA